MHMNSPQLNMAVAHANSDDLRRAAVGSNRKRHPPQPRPAIAAERSVTIRLGVPADQNRLDRLAVLDSSRTPASPILLAEVDGQLHAAIALSGGSVIADPFRPTADLIGLLRARAHQLNRSSPMRRSGRVRSSSRRLALG
jgi:hypothetical protein